MPRARRLPLRLTILVVVVTLGCATPIGVRRLDERRVQELLNRNATSSDEASVASRQVLLRTGLADRFEEDPKAALAQLHAITVADMTGDGLFALAEHSFLYAERSGRRPYFVAASLYAYAFLFPEDGTAPPDVFDPRLHVAAEIYNRAIARALISEAGDVALREGPFPFHLGTLHVEVEPAGFVWADRRLTNFVSSAGLDVRGLRNRYRTTGLGAPFVADAVPEEGRTVDVRNARLPETIAVAVTFLVRYGDARSGLRTGKLSARIEIYSENARGEIEMAGRKVRLHYETTSALAYGLGRSKLWDFEIAGYRRGDVLPVDDGLLMLRPYVPGRIPLVLVHGTASSPARWAEMLNELLSDAVLAAHYQAWVFLYTTGNPILYSASLLRQSLQDTLAELDPEGRDAALRQMVVVGHSQGGLLTKLQVISSGDRFWANVSDEPVEELGLRPETEQLIRRAAFFEPQPFVKRVVFISTPHRGSFLAGNWLGRIASDLFRAPQNLVGTSLDLARAGIDLASDTVDLARSGVDRLRGDEDAEALRKIADVPSSVDNMKPGHHFVRTLSSIPVGQGVIAHSIIPIRGGPPPEGQNDGVVEYSSAHIEEAASEYVVYHGGHSAQTHPECIREVRRILLEHLEQPERR